MTRGSGRADRGGEPLAPGLTTASTVRATSDWSDDDAVAILRNCRRAMGEGGRILLVEALAQPGQSSPATSADLMMLVLLTGRQRSEQEFRELHAAAGLKLSRVIPAGWRAILEGVRASSCRSPLPLLQRGEASRADIPGPSRTALE